MNTQSKSINVIKRLKKVAKSGPVKTQTPEVVQEPLINQLYSLDIILNGSLRPNTVARYAGRSRSGKYYNFELPNCVDGHGVNYHLLSLDKIPAGLKKLTINLFTMEGQVA